METLAKHRRSGKEHTCADCGKTFLSRQDSARFCNRVCAARWMTKHRRGNFPGKTQSTKGYILLWMPKHPSASKAGYVMEHRVVMEKKLGRFLHRNEVVHHINGNKTDNKEENLILFQKIDHDRQTNQGKKHQVKCPKCGHIFSGRGNVHYALKH